MGAGEDEDEEEDEEEEAAAAAGESMSAEECVLAICRLFCLAMVALVIAAWMYLSRTSLFGAASAAGGGGAAALDAEQLRCYARKYPDVFAAHCAGSLELCDYASVASHYEASTVLCCIIIVVV